MNVLAIRRPWLLLAASALLLALGMLCPREAHAQYNPLICEYPNVPCGLSGPFNTNTGDDFAIGAAKTNVMTQQLYNSFGNAAHLATAGSVNAADVIGLFSTCTSSPSTLVLYANGTCGTVLSTMPAFTGPVTTSAGSTATLLNLSTGGISGVLSVSLGGTGASGGPVAIASLPACNSGTQGQRQFVTNGATSPAFMGTVSATGSTFAPVFCNGTAWLYGG